MTSHIKTTGVGRCGDGTFLAHIYSVVRDRTGRGALLEQHPLSAREAELHADQRFQAAFPPSQLATVSINFFTARTDRADTVAGVERDTMLEIG